jgi:hypothetical protein
MDSGSLSEKAGQAIKEYLSGAGPLPDETVPDWIKLSKILNDTKVQNAQETLQRNDQTWDNKYAAAGPAWKSQVQTPAAGGGGQVQEGSTATGQNGHKIKFTGGKWVDAATGQPI